MAVPVSNFPILSFQQANPVLSGMSAGQDIQSQQLKQQYQKLLNTQTGIKNQYLGPTLQEQLLTAQLGNQVTQAGLPYVGPQAAANLGLTQAQAGENNARIPLYQAQANLAQQEASNYPYTTAAQFDPITKMIMGRQFLSKLQGLTTSPNGMTVQPQGAPQASVAAPSGQPMQTLPGGLTSAQGQQIAQSMPGLGQGTPAPQQTQMPGMMSTGNPFYDNLYNIQYKNQLASLTKNPAMGSARSGAGGTYTDPMTGQQYSTGTNRTTTLDQQTVAAIDRATPLMNDLVDNLGPFRTLKGQATLRAAQAGNFVFGSNNPQASQYAKGLSALQTAPESLLKAFGLNVTNESLHSMREAVEPIFGESAQGYKQRIIETARTIKENQQQAQARLSGGIPLGNTDSQGQVQGQVQGQGQPQQQAAPQIQATKSLNGQTYYKINGQWHHA